MSTSLKCEKCSEIYILGKNTISITSEETMQMTPFFIGQMPKSLQVGRASTENPNQELLVEAERTIMRLGPERGWVCNKCHYKNSWNPVYSNTIQKGKMWWQFWK